MTPPVPPSRQIYRAEALDRLGAPEQLEALVSVTRPGAWLGLVALWVLVAGFLWWALRGELTTRVAADGVIVAGPMQEVAATWGGRVKHLPVQVGDTVQAGDLVAELDLPDVTVALAAARSRRAELARTAAEQRGLAARTWEARRAATQSELLHLERAAREQDTVVTAWERRVADERALLQAGLVSQEAALASRQALFTARDALARTRVAQRTAAAALASADADRASATMSADQAVRDADRDIARLRADSMERAVLRSATDGVLVERLTDRGDVLVAGQAVWRLRALDAPPLAGGPADGAARGPGASPAALRAVVFVRADDGKRVRPGMTMLVSPSNTRPQDDGYLVGRVARVSEAPVSPQAVRAALRNEALAQTVSGGGAPFRVDVQFERAARGAGEAWTTRRATPPALATGTPARAWIVVERRAPITLVLPALRKRLQIGVVGE